MELIKDFGINPILLGAQIVNFLVVFFLLRKLLYRPVLEMLQKRQNTIKEGLRQGEEARQRLEKVLEEEKKILKNAQEQAKKIIEEVKLESLEIAKQIEGNAKSDADRLFKEAKAQISREAEETEKALSLNISNLAIGILKKSLEQFFSEKEQEEIMKKALKRIV